MHAKSLQLCPTLCDPTDGSLSGSSLHGILQARIREWIVMPCPGITNLDSILKSRNITLLTKIHIVMYRCESWTVKKAQHHRINVFELWWCWRRLLRVPWTARRSNKAILKKINPEYSLEGLMLKLKLHYFGHLIWGADSSEKTESRRRRGQQRME